MSQLASQLQILSSGKSKNTTKDARFKTFKPSFMFDANTAQEVDNQTVYEMGVNGLAELRKTEERFAPFERMLFNVTESTRAFDREGQTPAVLAKLDKTIASLLEILSPYFLLKPAHKVLEFLIRRYRIHDYCSEALLACVLPFHETTLFGRMLMLVKLTRRWEFLKDAQKKGAPLARSTLVTRCLADVSVLEFICNMAHKQTQVGTALAQHRLAVNFYTVMMVEALELATPVPEPIISLLLRHISKGVKAKECPEYRTASYMLSARLCTRAALSGEVASALANELTARLEATDTSASLNHALLPLMCLFQTQTLPGLPDKAFAALARLKELPASLGQLSVNYDLRRFLGGFLRKLCVHMCRKDAEEDADWEQHFALWQGLVAEVPIGPHVPALAEILLAESLASGRKALRLALLALDTSYPVQVTAALKGALNDAALPEKRRTGLVKLVTQAFCGTRHEMLAKAGTTLLLALEHPLMEMRLEGLSQVHAQLEAKKHLDPAVAHAVLGRLGDSEPETVVAALELPGLVGLVDAPVLLEALLGLLDNPPGAKPSQRNRVAAVTFKQLSALSQKHPDAGVQEAALPAVLAHLVATNRDWKVSEALLTVLPALSKAAPKKSAFQQLLAALDCKALLADLAKLGDLGKSADAGKKNKGKSPQDGNARELLDAMNRSLVATLGASIAAHPALADSLLPILARGSESARRLVLCAIVSGLRQATDKSNREALAACLSQAVQAQWRLHVKVAGPADAALASLADTEVPIPSDFASYELLLAGSLQALLEGTSEPPLAFLQALYVFFVSGPRSLLLDQLLTLLFQRHLGDLAVACDFLRPFWAASWVSDTHCDSDMGRVPLSCVVSSLHVVHAMVKVAQQTEKDLALEPLLPFLVVGASHRSKAVRHAALLCLKTLEQGLSELPGKHAAWIQELLTLLVGQHEELLADGAFLATVFGRSLSGAKGGKGHLPKESQKKILAFLLDFVRGPAATTPYVQWVVFSGLAKVPSSVLAEQGSLDLLGALLSNTAGASDMWSPQLLRLAVRQLDADTANTAPGQALLLRALDSTLEVGDCSVRRTALGCVDAPLFAALSAKQREALFDILAARFQEEDVAVACQNCLKRLQLGEALLGGKLQNALAVVRKANPAADRVEAKVTPTRMDDSDESDSDASEEEEAAEELSFDGAVYALKEATHTLELVQFALQQGDVTGQEKLVAHLFQLLGALLREELQQSGVEYPKQLILACLLGIFRSLAGTMPKGLSKKDIDLGVVVSCVAPSSQIRGEQHGAQRSQTRNHALLLLSCMADLVPELVLKVLVPIFANIYGSDSNNEEAAAAMREDDSYTFSVIQQTIETVIPPLAKHGLVTSVTPLVSIFAAAARQMSAPRALRILTVFHSTLGSALSGLPSTRAPASHLHECVALLAAYQLRLGKEKKAAPKNLEALHVRAPDTLLSQPDFCHHFMENFSAGEQTATLARLLHVLDLKKQDSTTGVLGEELVDERAQARWKVTVMRLVAAHLVRPSFAEKVRKADAEEGARVRETFLALFEKLLQMVKAGKTDADADSDDEEEEDDEEVELLKLGAEQVDLALSRLNKLLSVQALVAVASELLVNDEEHIRRKGLQLLRDKARHADLTESDTRLLLSVLPRLEALVLSDTEEQRTVVLALESVQVMCDALAPSTVVDCKAEFLELLPKLVAAVEGNVARPKVVAAGLRCVGGVFRQLSTRSLKHLATALNTVLSALERTLPAAEVAVVTKGKRNRAPAPTEEEETSVETRRKREVRGSALGALDALVEEMAKFCSPHLPRMLTALLHPALLDEDASMDEDAEHDDSPQVRQTLSTLAAHVAPRVLLPCIFTALDASLALGSRSVVRLLWLLSEALGHFDAATLKAEFKPVFKFLIQAFDLRRRSGAELDDIDAVEEATVGATMSLIVKLRESQLKALFLKLLEWLHLPVGVAAQVEVGGNEAVSRQKVDKCLDRAVVFFRLVLELTTTLKAIFVPYFGHILDHCVLLLTHVSSEEGAREQPKKRRRKEEGEDAPRPQGLLVQTQEVVLTCLQRCFEYDAERWLGKEFLTKISVPIVEQLELGESIREREEYLLFAEDVLAPCLEELAVRMANATLWKPLNYAVLLKARNDHAVVRRATIGVLRRFFSRLRESWLFLLPETIPFVAELMEDNDLLVERDIQLAIKDIETLSGESLEHYLK